MNKQALAFLTMFSLILMLSVYYVTLPADSTSVMEEQAPQSDKKADKRKTHSSKKTEDAQARRKEAQEQKKDTSESADGSTKLQDSINQKRKRRSTAIPVWLRIPKAMTVQRKKHLPQSMS